MGDKDVVDSDKGLSAVTAQEKGIRNKRKYLADMLLEVPLDVSGLSLTEFPRYELLEERLRDALRGALEARCDQCDGEQEVNKFQQAEWDDPLICQLEEVLSKNLFATFQSAIKKIVECGYDEKTAELLILKTGLVHGSKDVVSNTANGALVLLKRPEVLDPSRHHVFDNLQSLVEYTMLEMICVLREVKPSLTVAEAMWCLLICDLDLLHACAVNEGLDGSFSQEIPDEKLAGSINAQLTPKALETHHTNPKETSISKPSDSGAQSSQSEIPKVGKAPQMYNSRDPRVFDVGKTNREGSLALPDTVVKSSCITREDIQNIPQTSVVDEKSGGSRKGSSVNSKRDILRQKTFHLEKSYKGRMSKGSFKTKFSALGNIVLDKTMNSASGSSGVVMKSTSSKITAFVGANAPLSEEIHHHSSNSASLQSAIDSPEMLPMKATALASPALKTHIPAPSAVEPKTTSETKANPPRSSMTPDYYAGIPYEESLGKYVPRDEKDETILLLVPHIQALQKELQSWTDWANEKIMQATYRLSKDQAELRTLRQEKEEAEKFKKEKQTLEENTIKRLSEMEHAWSNANSQIEFANSTLRKLEAENSVLRQEMEAAKLQALNSAKSLQEAMRREQEALKNSQSWNLTKGLMQEELTSLKRDAADLRHQREKAAGRLQQIEALWKKEEKEKIEALSKARSMKERREQQEALMKAEEDEIRKKSESELQKYREEIKKLETEISVLRFQSESSKIAALRSSNSMDGKIASGFLGLQSHKRLEVFRDNFGAKNIKQERECVMCLSEEMSVVFLPCAHQVLCTECNALHEKRGMKECPSCRTLIQRRIQARFAKP